MVPTPPPDTLLSLDDQRVLLHIRQSPEVDPLDNRRVLDFSQLRDATGWSYDKTDGRVRSLESRGYLYKDYRDTSEMDTNRQPPRLFKLTDEAVDYIVAGGISDVMAQEGQVIGDPLELEQLFSRLEAVEELAEEKLDEAIAESKHYYKKVSREVDKLQTTSAEHSSKFEKIDRRQTAFGKEIESLNQGFTDRTRSIEEIQQFVGKVNTRLIALEYRLGVISRDRAEQAGVEVNLIDASERTATET
jgi:hypothetical protein